jgi:hypothetical protein
MAHYGTTFQANNIAKEGLVVYGVSKYPIEQRSERWMQQDYLQFVSIDPGEQNLAMRIERKYFGGRSIPILYIKEALGIPGKGSGLCDIFSNLRDLFDRFRDMFLESHIFIVEKQVKKNKELLIEIGQSIIMYFTILLADSPLIPYFVRMDSNIKYDHTHPLGRRRNLTRLDLKKWAAAEAIRLFTRDGDQFSIDVMNKHKSKQDDLGDVKLQIEAICKIRGLDFSKPKSYDFGFTLPEASFNNLDISPSSAADAAAAGGLQLNNIPSQPRTSTNNEGPILSLNIHGFNF